MNAEVVYQVFKALPKGEQEILFDKLRSEFTLENEDLKIKKKKPLIEKDAIGYLLDNVFKKSININKTSN